MKTHRLLATVLLLALACAAPVCVAAQGAASAPARAASASALARADLSFLKEAAQAGHAEVQAGQVALGKAVNTKVKGFAQQMVDDHGRNGAELAELARSKGVGLPDGPSVLQKGRIRLLSAKDGGAFDRAYARSMGTAAHRDALRLFERAAGSARDADVKAFASKTLPTLRQHLEMAKEMEAAALAEGNTKAPHDRKQ